MIERGGSLTNRWPCVHAMARLRSAYSDNTLFLRKGVVMLSAIVVCAGLMVASPQAPEASNEDLAAYESAKRGVGRDADAHVKLALWCEAHGLEAERLKHLALAVLIDPGMLRHVV